MLRVSGAFSDETVERGREGADDHQQGDISPKPLSKWTPYIKRGATDE